MHHIIHLGDAHLGPGDRNADRRRAIDQVITETIGLPTLAAYVWPGDLFHGLYTTDVDDRNWLDVRLQQMAAFAPVVICYGNHDPDGELDGFARLGAVEPGRQVYPIYVVSTFSVLTLQLATGVTASIFVAPYPSKGRLVAAAHASEELRARARAELDVIFTKVADDLEAARAVGHLTLMIGHLNVAGSKASSGQPQIGKEIELDAAVLNRLGPIYKGLNHIHRGQEIHGAHYAGSTCRLDRGETEPKRYLRIAYERVPLCEICGAKATCFGAYEGAYDPEGEAAAYHCDRCCGHGNEDGWCKPVDEGGIAGAPRGWCYTVESCPIDVAPIYYLEGDLTRDGFTARVLDGPGGTPQPAPASWAGCEVHVLYRYPSADAPVLDHEVVKAGFAEALRLHLEPVAISAREIRAPQVAAAVTLEGKVEAYLDLDGREPSVGLLLALQSLQQASHDQVIAGVTRWVRDVESCETPISSSVPVDVPQEALF